MTSFSLRSTSIDISDQSRVGEARRIAASLAKQLGLDEDHSGKVGIVVTEAANNLAKHAQQGQIILRPLLDPATCGIEILSVDRGPGMKNPQACLRDGFSTAGTTGNGLGSIARLSSEFDIYSLPNIGTALVSRIWMKPSAVSSRLEMGAVCLPMAGEHACGDNWFFKTADHRHLIALADGLGHGTDAAHAANEAIRIFEEKSDGKLAEVLQKAHSALRSTRGVAMSLVDVGLESRVVRFAGIGNIAGSLLDGASSRSMVSHNGTLGGAVQRFQEFIYSWPTDGLMVLHTDGLMTRWSLDPYPGLRARHPSLIAAILYRDFQRDRDDTTVLVVRERSRRTP